MGSCISKCRPKKHNLQLQTTNQIQDKLVISSTNHPNIIPPPPSNKISPCPQSPTSSTSSTCSFTCTNYTSNTSNTISSSNSSTSSSLLSSSKDRAFSNEFLWSCYKENPHIVRINSIKETSLVSSLPPKPVVLPNYLQRVRGSIPQKRVRSSSPVLTRQKSFRKEPTERPNVNVSSSSSSSSYSIPNRNSLRSPSPSRRFVSSTDKSGAHLTNTLKENVHSKRISSNGFSTVSYYSNNSRKENMWAPSPNNNSSRSLRSCLRNRETLIHRISSKIDEIAVNEALAHNDPIDSVPMEGIHNPLISLDCFIFL